MRVLIIFCTYSICLIACVSTQRIPIAPLDNTGNISSKYRYGELAETEFHRPGYYPIPFVVGGSLRTGVAANPQPIQAQSIAQNDLSELIRSHIADRRRLKQLTQLENDGFGTPLLTGVKTVTELRQTPYRRFPTNSSSLSYAEKRRKWKAELRRRLKASPRFLAEIPPPVLISEPTNNLDGEERYYVTYSPHSRIYQVSRRPPPHLYTSHTDQSPDSIDSSTTSPPISQWSTKTPTEEEITETKFTQSSDSTLSVQQPAEEEEEEEEEEEQVISEIEQEVKNMSSPSSPTTPAITTSTPSNQEEHDHKEDQQQEEVEASTVSSAILIKWTASTLTSSTPPPPTAITAAPPIFIIQRGEAVPIISTSEGQVKVAAVKPPLKMPIVKQILHLDDYDQDMEDEEEEQTAQTYHPSPVPTTPTVQPIEEIVRPTQPNYYVLPTQSRPAVPSTTPPPPVKQAVKPEEDDDEEDEDDFFFWKPGGAASLAGGVLRSGAQHGDPFEIVSHQGTVSKRRFND